MNTRELDQNHAIVFLCLLLPDLCGIECQIHLRFRSDTYLNANQFVLMDHRDVCFTLGEEIALILDRECPSVIRGKVGLSLPHAKLNFCDSRTNSSGLALDSPTLFFLFRDKNLQYSILRLQSIDTLATALAGTRGGACWRTNQSELCQ